LELDGRTLTAAQAEGEARDYLDARGAAQGARLLLRDDRDAAWAPFTLLLALRGSVVLVRNAAAGDVEQVARQEQAAG
ncbi:MAG: hypothetical protein ACKOT0_00505, partial [bacterium]